MTNKTRVEEQAIFSIIKQNLSVFWIADEKGKIIYGHSAWYPSGETEDVLLTDNDWLSTVYYKDKKKVERAWKKVLANKTEFNIEFRISRKRGSQWIHLRALPILDREKNAYTWVGVNTNITYYKKTEESYNASENRVETIFKNAEVGLSEIAMDGKFMKVNPALCKMLGRTAEELLSLNITDVTATEFIAPSLNAINYLVTNQIPVSLDKKYVKPSGEEIWANSTLSLVTVNSVRYILAVTTDLTARKAAEKKLLESEKSFSDQLQLRVTEKTNELRKNQNLLQATFDYSFNYIQILKPIKDDQGNITDFEWILTNKQFEEKHGICIGTKMLEKFPDIEQVYFLKLAEVFITGTPSITEVYSNNSFRQGWFKDAIVKTDYNLLINSEDITFRKKAENQLQQQNIALKEAQRLGKTGNFYFDKNTMEIYGSEEFYRITKIDHKGKNNYRTYLCLLEKEHRSSLFRNIKSCLKNGASFEMEVAITLGKAEEKTYLLIIVEPSIEPDTTISGLKGIIQDISAHKKAEQEIQSSKELLQSVFDTSLIGMSLLQTIRDENGEIADFKIKLVNKELERETGRKDLVDKSYAKEYPGIKEAGLFEIMKNVVNTGKPQGLEYFYPYEGFNKWFSCLFVKMDDGLVATNLDISDRKQNEEKIVSLNKLLLDKNQELETLNAELATFNDIAATDYNETLRALYLNIEFIKKNDAGALSNNGKANLRKAQSAIQKMKMLTEDLVAFSKIPEIDKEWEEIDLNATLESVLPDLEDKITEVEAFIDKNTLQPIGGYPLLVSILLYHLIDNALKFRDNHRRPVIQLFTETLTIQPKSNLEKAEYIVLNVKDNGLGFDESEAENIFNIFYKVPEKQKYRGTGIGLAVCKKIMSLHKGHITAESKMGSGTVIRCFFPK